MVATAGSTLGRPTTDTVVHLHGRVVNGRTVRGTGLESIAQFDNRQPRQRDFLPVAEGYSDPPRSVAYTSTVDALPPPPPPPPRCVGSMAGGRASGLSTPASYFVQLEEGGDSVEAMDLAMSGNPESTHSSKAACVPENRVPKARGMELRQKKRCAC
mmetsp:Transcript_28152/g.62226  ORF Transcript_28152/g.62226 Transcript_28152/m.62226 type:complete len:157 (+) Transcript_28152:68-538(+)